MRLNDLERALETIPPHPKPRAELEQYPTPAELAARLLFEARALGDVEGRRVVDLGCGTGVLAIGASLLGAAEVVGVDVDGASLEVARGAAERLGADVDFVEADVRAWTGAADVVLMNPPFGAQVRGADRPFLDAALATAPVVYALHNAPTRAFVEAYAAERGFSVTHAWALRFPIRQRFRHHTKAVQDVDVVALRYAKHKNVDVET